MKRVLVAHSLSRRMRTTTIEFVMAFGRYAPPDVDVEFFNIRRPDGRSVNAREFDALVLPYDLLSLRSSPQWGWVLDRVGPLADRSERVLAFPQDDYTYNAVLDSGLDQLGTDVIFTPIETGVDIVYPVMHRKAKIRNALTGYVDEPTARARRPGRTPIADRPIDVGQRVRMLPPWFGRSGLEKGLFAQRFARLASQTDLTVDISTDDQDVFSGDDWYGFLGSAKATIGQKGGASLCDPDGSIMRAVLSYQEDHPAADFDEIEQACFPGLDGQAVMRAISPRLFDAAMLGTAQVLVRDDYLGALEPWVHYIPTDQALSNFDEIVAAIEDHSLLSTMAEATEDALIQSGRFTYRTFVADVFETEVVETGLAGRVDPGVDLSEQLQWRLSADLFEAVQRSSYLAWVTGSAGHAAELVEEISDVLVEYPSMVDYLDSSILESVIGELNVSRGLDAVIVPFVDVAVECFRAGAAGGLIKWLRYLDASSVNVWSLIDWIDRERIDLDTEVPS